MLTTNFQLLTTNFELYIMFFIEKLKKIIEKNQSFICVGLDSDVERIKNQDQFSFNKKIIDETNQYVCSYKLNTAFYEAIGYKGVQALEKTCYYIKTQYPEIPIIIDGKRADIGNTNKGYEKFFFDYLKADAITVNPYLGEEALRPFLERKDKGIIVLCKTSNLGSSEFQNIEIKNLKLKIKDCQLYEYIAYKVSRFWNKNKNCLLVVGATYHEELKKVRQIVGDKIWFLVPGIGAQGGDLKEVLKNGLNMEKQGLIINISRSVIFSENPKKEVMKFKKEMERIVASS